MIDARKLPPKTPHDRWLRDMASGADQSQRVKRTPAVSTLPPLHVLVDTREQTPWRFTESVTTEFCTLTEGDYSLRGFSGRVRVERKSLADLVGSITVGRERFLAECQRLMAYEFRLLVIEASIDDVECHNYRSETNPKSVLSSVLAIHLDYGLPGIWAGNAKSAARIVEYLFRRMQKKWSVSDVRT